MHIVCFTSIGYVDSDRSLMLINTFCKKHGWPHAHIVYRDMHNKRCVRRIIEIKNVTCNAELLEQIKEQPTPAYKPRYIIGETAFYAEGLTKEE